ncbi:MAG: type II toxin-antitoxin system Phd/YefM family antitoxin [Candidatus Binataceae bacterium]
MEQSISASDANRKFSELLRNVRAGRSYIVTAHGKPVARIVPADTSAKAKSAAWEALIKRLRSQRAINIGPWTRDELYDD